MTRQARHPAEIRRIAAAMARADARECESDGDPEGAGRLRDLAARIDRIRLTSDR